jgi:hypothetical protein
MKKQLTNKMMLSDIRKARANIFDQKAIGKLRENLHGGWKLHDTAEPHQLTKEELHHYDEEHKLHKLAHYLVEVSALAELTQSLKKAVESKEMTKAKEYLYKFRQKLKELPIRTEEDQEIFSQLQKELGPILIQLGKTPESPHLQNHIEQIIQIINAKLAPQKWKHAA